MKKIALLLFALLAATPARAGVTCSLPFNLQNGTTADATQVMANYTALVTCLTNAAAAGANNDITSLSALSTPITTAQGGTQVYTGGASTGSANAQAVASVSPSTFSLTAGKQVTFIAGFSNSGPLTLNVASAGATNVYRRTQLGVSAAVGGEIVAGQQVTVIYDGTQFQLLGERFLVGSGGDWFTATAPAGYLFRNGAAISRTTYADLFSVIGTTYGVGDGVTTFNLPDEQGRMSVMKDGASRITGACAAANTLGTACGQTAGTATIAQANLPAVTLNTDIAAGQGSHGHVVRGGAAAGGSTFPTFGATANNLTENSDAATLPGMTGTTPLGGSGTALTVLNGSLVVNKIIKY